MSPTQSQQVVGFAKESTYGTFTTPTGYAPATCTVNDALTATKPAQSRGTRSQVIDVITQLTMGVQIQSQLIPEVLSTLIAGWFGKDAISGTGTTGYSHTLTPFPTLPSYTIEVDSDVVTQVLARQVLGNVIDQFTVTYSANQLVAITFQTVAQQERTPATPGLPSNPTPAISSLIPYDFSLLYFGTGLTGATPATPSVQLIDATLTCSNQAQAVYTSNNKLSPFRVEPTLRQVTFSTTLDFVDASWFNYWKGSTGSTGFVTGGMTLTLVSNVVIAGANPGNYYTVMFNLPTLRPQDQFALNAASDVLQQQLTWSVTQGSASNEINGLIKNSESAALV